MTFDSANDWVLGAGWSLTGGSLVYSGNSITVASLPLSVLPVAAGQSFQIEIRLSSLSGDTIYVGIGNAYCQLTTYSSTFSITAIAAKALEIQGGPGSTVSVDYIRVVAGGRDGKSVRYGTNDPVATDGTDGDFWINTTTHFIFGPKASGAWPAGTSLVGPAGSGGGGLVLLEQHTASNSATLDFKSFISSTYDEYAIEVLSLRPGTNNVNLFIQMSTDHGATWDTASNYSNKLFVYGGGTTGYGSTLSGIVLNYPPSAIRDTAPVGVKASLHLFLAQQTTDVVTIIGNGISSAQDNNQLLFNLASYYNTAGASVNAIRFLFSTGNIASGTIRIYGIAK
jgi:hypothetical protein